jgi:hypothetical protein
MATSLGIKFTTARMRISLPVAGAQPVRDWNIDMDIFYLLLTGFLAAITLGLIFVFERLQGAQ